MKKEELIIGGIYEVEAPKFHVAIWTGTHFRGPSVEPGGIVFVNCCHFDDGLPFGVVTPIDRIGELTVSTFDGSNLLAAMNALDILAFELRDV